MFNNAANTNFTHEIKNFTHEIKIGIEMKSNLFLSIMVMSGTLCGCSGANGTKAHLNSDGNEIVEVKVSEPDGKDSGSNFVKSVDCIPMQESSEAMFVNVDKMIYDNDEFYMLDRMGDNTLAVFDKDGKYLRSIGAKGEGPEEYVRAWDFDVDKRNVYIYDRMRDNMLVFKKSGEFIKSLKIPKSSNGFVLLENGGCIFAADMDNSGNQIVITDSLMNPVKEMMPFAKGYANDFMINNILRKTDKGILYYRAVSDTVYMFSGDGEPIARYAMNLEGRNVPKELQLSFEQFLMSGKSKDYAYLNDSPMILGDRMVGTFVDRDKRGNFIYDLKKGTTLNVARLDPETVGVHTILSPVGINGNFIYGIADENALAPMIERGEIPDPIVDWVRKGNRVIIRYEI